MRKFLVIFVILGGSLCWGAVTQYHQFEIINDATNLEEQDEFDYGDYYFVGTVECRDVVDPPIFTAVDGSTVTGTGNGQYATVSGFITQAQAQQQSQIVNTSFSERVIYNDGPPRVCGGLSIIYLTLRLDDEYAYTKVLRLKSQPPVNCIKSKLTGLTYCDYPVVQWCTVPVPDFNPKYINDVVDFIAAKAYAYCTRDINPNNASVGPWVCLGLIAFEIGDTSIAPDCTYHPSYP